MKLNPLGVESKYNEIKATTYMIEIWIKVLTSPSSVVMVHMSD